MSLALLELDPSYLSRLELLRLNSRRTFLGSRQGSHLSMKKGHGMEFSDYRTYQLGDNPRSIDWGVYARSEKLYVKRFQEEEDLPIFILLDGTRSMHEPTHNQKWLTGLQIAVSLAYIGLMQQDTIRISVPGAFYSPAYTGAKSFHSIIKDTKDLKPTDHKDFNENILKAVSQFTFPGLTFFISDFLSPLKEIRKSLDLLRAKNLDICCIQVLGPDDINPAADLKAAELIDSETGKSYSLALDSKTRQEYSKYLVDHNEKLKNMCQECGIRYNFAYTEEGAQSFIFQNLRKTGLVR